MKNAKSLLAFSLLVIVLFLYPSSIEAKMQQYAMVGCDDFMSYWTIPEGECLWIYSGFNGMGVTDVTISSDGLYDFACDNLGAIEYYRITDGKCMFSANKHG